MKTIGLLGGMSWESTLTYYRLINEGVKQALGGLHSAQTVLYSVDFGPIERLQHQGDWEGLAEILTSAAQCIQHADADFLVICSNTVHKVFPEVEAAIEMPVLHIADAMGEALVREDISTVGLLGTAFTMEQDFYSGRLQQNYGLRVLTPNEADRALVHRIIYQELCLGKLKVSSKETYLRIVDSLAAQGAQAVILGCTEIGMLVKQDDTQIRLYDTTAIHAQKAVAFAL